MVTGGRGNRINITLCKVASRLFFYLLGGSWEGVGVGSRYSLPAFTLLYSSQSPSKYC